MTLSELRDELLQLGIKQVGAFRLARADETRPTFSFVFSADEKTVVPFALKTAYFLALDSIDPDAPVHSEKYKALMRSIERDRQGGNASTVPIAPEPHKRKFRLDE